MINGEAIAPPPKHPLLRTDGQWIPAGELEIGNAIRRADGEFGTVEAIEFAATPQVMYNMTVADAHTYTVGDGEWVVHNSCWTSNVRRGLSPVENAFEHWKKHRADFPSMNNGLPHKFGLFLCAGEVT